MTATQSRDQYLQNAVLSASPARLLVMLMDRLYLDMQRAEHAIAGGNAMAAGEHLLHAQDIVTELTATLKVEVWEGARHVQALYLFLYSELVNANVSKDLSDVYECKELVSELRQTWTQAAQVTAEDQGLQASQRAATRPQSGPVRAASKGLGELGVG
ncbi:flagellar export chaperone FliS [Jonesiaceae bacterium BS-20]|uniref:Flagellar export chaperone FliS n=1 Tax=Jonesiaceae bacterium BS-20 TaxID=3120821 RepID=A0AAU7DVU3_9MICO